MATELNIYGEFLSTATAADVVITGATLTVPAGQQIKITKLQAEQDNAAGGYVYLRLAGAHRYGFYFWGAGQQSENFISMLLPAASVVDMVWDDNVAANVRASATGTIEMIPI